MNRVIIVGVQRGVGWGVGDIVCSQNILFRYKTDMSINGGIGGGGWVRQRFLAGLPYLVQWKTSFVKLNPVNRSFSTSAEFVIYEEGVLISL